MTTRRSHSLRHAGRCLARPLLAAFGWFNVALGVIGTIVPGMPTTVFLLIALWAFSKSSERFRIWLYEHPRFGRTLRDWHEHRAIPPRAKALAITSMGASLLFLTFVVAEDWMLPAIVAAIMAPVAFFILTRPSRPLA